MEPVRRPTNGGRRTVNERFLRVNLRFRLVYVTGAGHLSGGRWSAMASFSREDCAQWQDLAEHGEVLLCRFDRDGRLRHANGACTRFFGESEAALRGRRFTQFVELGDRHRLTEDLAAVEGGHHACQGERLSRRADGMLRTLLWQHQELRHRDAPDGWHAVAIDVTDLHAARVATDRLVHLDPLTELPNRRLFEDRLERAEARLRRDGTRFAVLLLDVDHFKQVNDSFGHAAGDALLRELSRRLAGTLRETDTLARLGGDEFAVLQPDVDCEASVDAVARKITAAAREPIRVAGHDVRIGVSIGIAVAGSPVAGSPVAGSPVAGSPVAAGSVDDSPVAAGARLLEQADRALYAVKESGRGFHTFDTSALGAAALSDLDLARALDETLVDGGLYLLWQPEYDLRNQRIAGVEALVRWRRPDGSTIGPGRLIPIAERHGLIQRLGDWVLDQALGRFAAWRSGGVDVPRLSINVSGLQFRDEAFAERVHRALERYGLPGHVLELEVAERGLGIDDGVLERGLERLATLGVSVAIDDYGTGPSSFGALRRFAFTRVKVSQELAQRALSGSDDRAVLRAAVSLAGGLGVEAVVEGIETCEALRSVRDLGVNSFQGYLLSEPEDSDAMERTLRDPRAVRARIAAA